MNDNNNSNIISLNTGLQSMNNISSRITLEAKSFKSQVTHGAGAYLWFQ